MHPDYAAALLRALFTQPPVGLYVLDPDLRIVRFNAAAPGAQRFSESEAVGHTLRDLGFVVDEVDRMLRGVLATGEPVSDFRYEGRLPRGPDGVRVLTVSAFRLLSADGRTLGVAATVVDITEQHRAQRRLELLYRAGGHIGTTLDVFRTAQELADIAAPGVADVVAVDVLDSVLHGEAPAPGPLLNPVTLRRAGFRAAAPEAVRTSYEVGDVRVMRYGSPYAQSLTDLRPRLIRTLGADERWPTGDPAAAQILRDAGAHSLMAVPVAARGVVLGIAAFFRTEGSPPFEEADLSVAADLVARAAVCIDNARRYTREHTLARLTQRSLVPARLPTHTAVETAYTYLPVASSGAWYDVIPLSGARVALVAGDVSGRGMGAVTTMGRLRTAVTAFAAMDLPPDELLQRLHSLTEELSYDHPPGQDDHKPPLTATCLYTVYDPTERSCVFSSAGHPPPILGIPDGTVRIVGSPTGPVLGRGASSYTITRVDVPEGSILALRNAGLIQGTTESRLPLYREVLGRRTGTLQDTCDALAAALLPEPPDDDALLLLARTRSLGPQKLASWTLANAPESAAEARRLVSGRLAEWGLTDLDFTTGLIASELVTNAVRYSEGPIGLRLIRDAVLTCEVEDFSNASPHLRHAEDDDEGGRGLYLVAQFSQAWGARRTGRGKTIWTEQTLL
ncbi:MULTISPECIES: SpoIIE family protein phosphatase [unclassified Streptomyces]|uniref:ATP-binding SpoIIE family protein phosphatase n=1 Tax=unclassified Streptomyces TaxID=2593676 RepID=UPI002DDC8EBB|nr:SpoIIE family protein phosphatase [Streptomyces sp. NBC_01750]WSB01053.1 SpoIIE family protein phosphatase [Streptomyces sp. NBC_01794]WSD34595.1 SpoIIE family protein phosphatase [Streptomyces sp. NBC_01750]